MHTSLTCKRASLPSLQLLLFFHHLPWNWTRPEWKGATLFDMIRNGHADALVRLKSMAMAWDSLAGSVSKDAFHGVQARFAQQLNDAAVFSEVLVGYYAKISGAHF